MTTTKFDCKMAVVGDGGVGKSTFILQFVQQQFVKEIDPTISVYYIF
jgi:GTPase SAR1 family protein